MSEPKYTPGPWSRAYIYGAMRHVERNVEMDAYLDQEDQDKITGVWDEAKRVEVAAEFNTPSCRTNPADVDLITASPDMLEALEECLLYLNNNEIRDLARAAIAKAKGTL